MKQGTLDRFEAPGSNTATTARWWTRQNQKKEASFIRVLSKIKC